MMQQPRVPLCGAPALGFGCDFSPVATGQLGAVPIAAVPVAVSTFTKILGGLGLSSSDPDKDRIRFGNVDLAYELAMQGDTGVYAELGNRAPLQYLQVIAAGGMESGSKAAAAYAKVRLAEYQARYAAGGAGLWLVDQSPIPGTVAAQVRTAAPWLIGTAAVLGIGYALTRRGRR
jgi:hypothetical protein